MSSYYFPFLTGCGRQSVLLLQRGPRLISNPRTTNIQGHDFPNSPKPHVPHPFVCPLPLTSLGVVAVLLKTLAINDVNKKTQASGSTPLLLAVKHGHADVALALVRAGGDVNLTDNRGRSPLIRATYGARAELVNDLLLRGSPTMPRTRTGPQLCL